MLAIRPLLDTAVLNVISVSVRLEREWNCKHLKCKTFRGVGGQQGTRLNQRRVAGTHYEAAVIWADRLTFVPHAHDEYVLSCNISGNETGVLDGRPFEAAESCTTLYNPGQIQSGDGTNCLVSLYLHPDYFEYEGLSEKPVFMEKPIVPCEAMAEAFTCLISDIFLEQHTPHFDEAATQIIGRIMDRHTNDIVETVEEKQDWRVRRAKEILLDNLHRTVDLNEIVSTTGLNKVAIIRLFKGATGFTPMQWHRAQRLYKAVQMLKLGANAASTALDTGFADQAHFTRLFNRAYGMSPGRFQEMHSRSRQHVFIAATSGPASSNGRKGATPEVKRDFFRKPSPRTHRQYSNTTHGSV